MSDFNWTDVTEAFLRQLWDEGLSATEIGRTMGISKHAVAGKAHRLNLTPRPSPIRTRNPGDPAKPKIKRAPKVTLPGVASPKTNRTTPVERHTASGRARLALSGPTLPTLAAERSVNPTHRVAARPPGQLRECQWPLTNGRPWRFCCVETVPGKPYCAAHVKQARATSHETTPAAIANMVHRPGGAIHPGTFEEVDPHDRKYAGTR